MNPIGYDMLYLSLCAINGDKPDIKRVLEMDLDQLYRICQSQSLVAIVCIALESAGIVLPLKWLDAKSKAIRKTMLFDAEREVILSHMEKNQIAYMPMKGAILKNYYPQLGMRQMSDNDILIDPQYRHHMRDFMLQRGYMIKNIHSGHDDSYMKAPVYHFELHVQLFTAENGPAFFEFSNHIQARLLHDKENQFGYHMSDEDFYVYMIAHGYKHSIGSGIGLRLLLDCLVYLRVKNTSMNWSNIRDELDRLGIAEYEQQLRQLSQKLAKDSECHHLSPQERVLLENLLTSETFGNAHIATENRLKKLQEQSSKFVRLRYLWHRTFPNMTFYQVHYPFYYHHKWLLPFAWCIRCFRWLMREPHHKQLQREWHDLKNWKN